MKTNTNKNQELNEFTELPKRHSRINPTGKPTKYWVAVDEYSDSLNSYSKYVTPNMQLKDVGHNATPPMTVDKKQAVALAKRAIAKFPKWYVFVGQDKSSHGVMTGKDHLRASVLYIWDPVLKLWNDNVEESAADVHESILDASYAAAMELVCEGGAAGHMSHVFESPNLKFKELKDIFTKLFTGKIGIFEKTDGQNLAITYKDGQVLAARNKATLKDPIDVDGLNKLFADKPQEVRDVFAKSMKDLTAALKALDQKQLNSIFANGQNYLSLEIIYPPTKNIVDYGGKCMIQLHGVIVYDDKFNNVGEDKEAAERLYNYLKSKDALNQETFEITRDAKLRLKDSKTGEESLKIVLNKLTELVDGLGWNATIQDYARERFERYVINQASAANLDIAKNSDFVRKLADRLNAMSKSAGLKTVTKADLATYAKHEGIDPKSQEFKDFVSQIDSTKNDANQLVIKPLEDLVIGAGLLLMKNLVGYVSADPAKSAKKLSEELEKTIQDLSSKEAELDDSKLARFKKNLAKLDEYQREMTGAEGVVFAYKGKVYKMTSTFGAANQLMGILKYKR